jgi:glycosyltransferase involved in cell wall biosynthesis
MFRRLLPSRFSDEKSSRADRVLFVRRTTAFGGSEAVIVELLKAVDYEKNAVFLASPVDVFSGTLSNLKLPVTCTPATPPFSGGSLRVLFSWLRYFARLAPNKIILAEGGFEDLPLPVVLAAFLVARRNVWMMELHPAPEPPRKSSALHFGSIPGLGLWWHKAMWAIRARAWFARGILSVSHGVKDRLVRMYGYAPRKVTVVYNGVDTNRFSPAPPDTRSALRTAWQIPDEAIVLVSAARLDRIKRLDRLIQAFSALSRNRDDLWLLLTGEGPLHDELANLACSVHRGEKIRFLGHVEDVCSVLRGSDIYVLPSDEEGFGIALVEAMASKLVCVATRTVGPSEIIEDGRTGFLVDRSYEGVVEGLERALGLGCAGREGMGSRARQRVLKDFRVEDAAAKGLAFLEIKRATEVAR